MEEILLLTPSTERARTLGECLADAAGGAITPAFSGKDARSRLAAREYALVVIDAPLPDETGVELALELTETGTSGLLLLVPEAHHAALAERVESDGVLTLAKPVKPALLLSAARLCLAARRRMLGLHRENQRLQSKLDELKLVDRAKCVLIQYLGLSEPQAHRYIEKQAMDRRISRLEMAQGILKTYET